MSYSEVKNNVTAHRPIDIPSEEPTDEVTKLVKKVLEMQQPGFFDGIKILAQWFWYLIPTSNSPAPSTLSFGEVHKLAELAKETLNLNARNEQILNNNPSQEIIKLEEENNKLRKEIEKLRADKQNSDKQNESMQRELQQFKKDLSNLKGKHDKEISTLNEKCNFMSSQLERILKSTEEESKVEDVKKKNKIEPIQIIEGYGATPPTPPSGSLPPETPSPIDCGEEEEQKNSL